MTKAKEGEFVPGYALHEFPFFIWYTYPQLLLKNAAPRPGSFFDRHGGSVLGRRQQTAFALDTQVRHATPLLQVADGQGAQLGAAQAVIQQRGQDGAITSTAQGVGVRRIEQGARLVIADG